MKKIFRATLMVLGVALTCLGFYLIWKNGFVFPNKNMNTTYDSSKQLFFIILGITIFIYGLFDN
jgi:hypothetical protein